VYIFIVYTVNRVVYIAWQLLQAEHSEQWFNYVPFLVNNTYIQ